MLIYYLSCHSTTVEHCMLKQILVIADMYVLGTVNPAMFIVAPQLWLKSATFVQGTCMYVTSRWVHIYIKSVCFPYVGICVFQGSIVSDKYGKIWVLLPFMVIVIVVPPVLSITVCGLNITFPSTDYRSFDFYPIFVFDFIMHCWVPGVTVLLQIRCGQHWLLEFNVFPSR